MMTPKSDATKTRANGSANVANLSPHQRKASLKRYTHMRQTGDKYAGWVWLERLGINPP
jgi:hypothetical protein